ncbi:MAG: hypothetical protein H0V82_12550 [Candidatus Protochlamydia sp.]|nr:hypothetical protein [Candidatus Protochlamydia sp.]
MKKTFALFVFIISVMHRINAAENQENYSINFLLPIDWSTKNHIDLSVTIPKGYRSMEPNSTWDKAELIEFIPINEEPSKWSEIITIHRLEEKNISSEKITDLFLQKISEIIKTDVIFNEISNDDYQTSYFMIKYAQNGKKEIMGAKYVSGPVDCEGVQYTIRLKPKQSEQEAIVKIEKFFDQNLNVLKGQ